MICDRGYDADWWRERLDADGHEPVVPGRRNGCEQPVYDETLYRARHLIENIFARLKSARRIAPATSRPPSATTLSWRWPASASGSCDFEDVS